MLTRMTRIDCVAALKALGEPTRLKIIGLLIRGPLGVNEVAGRLRLSQYNVSRHLRTLREAGILVMEKRGKQHLYRVVPRWQESLANGRDVLDLGCCSFRFDRLLL